MWRRADFNLYQSVSPRTLDARYKRDAVSFVTGIKRNRKTETGLAVAEVLEPRVLYSADALGPLAPLFPDNDPIDPTKFLSTQFLSASSDASTLLEAIDWTATDETGGHIEPATTPGADDSLVEIPRVDINTTEPDSVARQIAFVDVGIPGVEEILLSLERSGIETILIDSNQNGLQAISLTLAERQDIDVVHVVSHGQSGSLFLGNTTLNASTISDNPAALTQWADALSADADILFYGCDFAADEAGRQLLERIAKLTGADVAASDDPTGHLSTGGDWQLEASVGEVQYSTFDDAELRASWDHSLATITVTVLTDAIPDLSLTVADIEARGPGADVTLREAVVAANNTAGNDTIVLGDGTYQLTVQGNGEESTETGDLDIAASGTLTIQGNGSGYTIIEQTVDDRVFDLNSGELHLEKLAVTNGERSTVGAGVNVNAGARLFVRDALFEGNDATDGASGGAIYNVGNTEIYGSVFRNNTATNGGAIYNYGGMYISNTEFNGSSAANGGAIFNDGNLAINGGSIKGNASTGQGAGIYSSSNATAIIKSMVLADNTAMREGGAIYTRGDLSLEWVTIDNNQSQSSRGGGVFQHSGNFSATDVIFSNNHSDNDGGGAYIRGNDAHFNRVTFSANTAESNGGGVSVAGENSTFVNTTFSENSAMRGGGISTSKDITVTSSTFYRNEGLNSAGAIAVDAGSIVTLSNSVFDNNVTNHGSMLTDIKGKVDSGGFNLFTTLSQIIWINHSVTDLVLPDMMLEDLLPGQGYVTTHAPMPDSPVINAGGSVAHTIDASNTAYDQMPDVGAHEASSMDSVIFWSDTNGYIWRSNTDYTNEQVILGRVPGFNATTDIEVDMESGQIFWLEHNGAGWEVWRANIDGSGAPVKLVYGLFNASAIAVSSDTGRVYILQGGDTGRIVSFNISDGAGSRQETDQVRNGHDIEYDELAQRLIWTEDKGSGSNGRIMTQDLNSGAIQTLYEDNALDKPEGLALDTAARRIYFVDTVTNTGYLIDYDGLLVIEQQGVSGERLAYDFIENDVEVASLQNRNLTAHDESLIETAITDLSIAAPEALTIGHTSGVNNVPVVSLSGPITVDIGASVQLNNTMLEVTDDYSNDAQLSWEIVTLPSHGVIAIDGTDIAGVSASDQRFTQELIEEGSRVTYVHNGLDNSGSDQFVVRVSDGQGVTTDITVNVLAVVNPAPTMTTVPLDLTENETVKIENIHLSSTDDSDTPSQLKYTVTALPVGAQVQLLNNGVWQAATEFTQWDVDSLLVRYVQGGGEPDSENDQIELTVEDSQGVIDTGNLSLNIENVNDNPTLFVSELTVPENGNALIESDFLHGLDDDVSDGASQLVFAITGLPAGAEVQLSTNGVWQAAAEFTQENIENGFVRYVHGGGEPDHGNDIIALTLIDGQGGSASGVLSLNVVNANDSPVLFSSGSMLQVLEGQNVTISNTHLLYTDTDDDPSNLRFTVDTANTGKGILWLISNDGISPPGEATTFTQEDVNNNRLVYVHGGGEDIADSFAYTITDGDVTLNGTLSLEIVAVNDAPEISFNTISINEGDSVALDSSQITIADSDHAIDLLTVEVTGAQHGTVTLAGGANGVATSTQFLASELVYTHNGLSTGNDTLTVRVTDPGGLFTEVTIPIGIRLVNDMPVLTTTVLDVDESWSSSLTTAQLQATDEETPDGELVYELSGSTLSEGVLLDTTGNVRTTFTQQEVIDGSISYYHFGQEPAAETMAFELVDSDGARVAGQLTIQISPTNDVPVISFIELNINEGDVITLDTYWIDITDSDHAIADLQVEVTGAQHGTVTLAGGANAVATGAQFLAGDLVYTHNGLSTGNDTLTVRVTDPGGAVATAMMPIDIQTVNDNPVLTTAALLVEESGSSSLTIAQLQASDEETVDGSLVYELLANTLSEGELRDAAGNVRTTFTQQDVIDERISYHHFGHEPAAETMEFELIDSDGARVAGQLSIQISPINDAPLLVGSISEQHATEREYWSLQLDTSLWTDSDEGDSVAFSATLTDGQPLPSWLNFDPVTALLSGTPGNNDVGQLGIVIDAQDQSGAAAQSLNFDLLVSNVNSAPYELVLDNSKVNENEPGAYIGQLSAKDADIGDQLSYSVNDDRFYTSGTALYLKLDVMLDHETEPTIDLVLSASDTAGLAVSKAITISVSDQNDSPQLVAMPDFTPLSEGETLVVPESVFTDVDGDEIAYSAALPNGAALPEWLEFRSDVREFVLVDSTAASDELEVQLTAEDGRGGRAQTLLTLQFEPNVAAAEPDPEPVTEPSIISNQPLVVEAPETQQELQPVIEPENTTVAEVESQETESSEQQTAKYKVTEDVVEEIDLRSLITPIPAIGSVESDSIEEISDTRIDVGRVVGADTDVDTIDLAALLNFTEHNISRNYSDLVDALDRQRDEMSDQTSFAQTLVGGSVGITSGLSVGYLIWLIRGGTLMGSMLSSLPAWRFVDPLPVLSTLGDMDAEDDESLESLVAHEGQIETTADDAILSSGSARNT